MVTRTVTVNQDIPETLLVCVVSEPENVGRLAGWRDYTLQLYAEAVACENNVAAIRDIVKDN